MHKKTVLFLFISIFFSFQYLPATSVEVFASSLPERIETNFDEFAQKNELNKQNRARAYKYLVRQFESTSKYLKKSDAYLYERYSAGIFDIVKGHFSDIIARNDADISMALLHLGNINLLDMNMEEALDYYIRAASYVESSSILEPIAEAFFLTGNYTESAQYFERAITVWSEEGRRYTISVASFLTRASISYNAMKENDISLKYAIEAFEIYALLRGEADIITGDAALFVGDIYYKLEEFESALSYYKRGLDVYLKSEVNNVEGRVANAIKKEGETYFQLNLDESALKAFTKVLVIDKRTLDEFNPRLADAYKNTGEAFSELGYYSEAMLHYKAAYNIYKQSDRVENQDFADVLNMIGGLYFLMGQYDEALTYLEKSLAIITSVLGENHQEAAAIYNNIGNIYFFTGDYLLAEDMFNRAMLIFASHYGATHLSVADSMSNIGLALKEQGKLEESKAFVVKGYELRKEVLDVYHPDLSSSLDLLGEIEEATGNFVAALTDFKESVEIKKKIFGQNSVELAEGIARIAFHFLKVDPEKSLPYLVDARSKLILAGREDHPLVYEIQKYISTLEEYKGRPMPVKPG